MKIRYTHTRICLTERCRWRKVRRACSWIWAQCESLPWLTVEKYSTRRQKIKNRTKWPSNPTSWYLPEEIQNTNLKRYMHPYIHCSIIYSSQDMDATWVPIDKRVGKEDAVLTYNKILLGHKKEERSHTICDNTDGCRGYYAKWNKSEKDKCHMMACICGT